MTYESEHSQALEELRQARQLMAQLNQQLQGIDARITAKETEVDQMLSAAARQYGNVRLTLNQNGVTTADGHLDGYSKNAAAGIQFSAHRTIQSGFAWSSRDQEERDILQAMGLSEGASFFPAINVVKMVWSGAVGAHTFWQTISATYDCTIGCYAKLVSGQISGGGFQGLTTEWGVCGGHYEGSPGRVFDPYPVLETATGEVLFCWYGVVSGRVPINRNAPAWGWFPHLAAATSVDITK